MFKDELDKLNTECKELFDKRLDFINKYCESKSYKTENLKLILHCNSNFHSGTYSFTYYLGGPGFSASIEYEHFEELKELLYKIDFKDLINE